MGGQAGITGHVELGDRIQIGAQSGVSKSLLKSGVYFGSPAMELKTALKRESYIRGLSEQIEKIKKLEEKIASLEQKISELSK